MQHSHIYQSLYNKCLEGYHQTTRMSKATSSSGFSFCLTCSISRSYIINLYMKIHMLQKNKIQSSTFFPLACDRDFSRSTNGQCTKWELLLRQLSYKTDPLLKYVLTKEKQLQRKGAYTQETWVVKGLPLTCEAHKWQIPGQGDLKQGLKTNKSQRRRWGGVCTHKCLQVYEGWRDRGEKSMSVPVTKALNIKWGAGYKGQISIFQGDSSDFLTFRNNLFCSPVIYSLEKSLKQ